MKLTFPLLVSLNAQHTVRVDQLWTRERLSGGINSWSRVGFCSDPGSFSNRERAQRLLFNFSD